MPTPRPAAARLVRPLLVLSLVAPSLAAQSGLPSRGAIPIAVQVGIPQGAFADNVDVAFGIGGGGLFRLSSIVAFRAELGASVYGSETNRVTLGTGPLGRITADVTTTNQIFGGGIGLQLGIPGPGPRPYLGGTIGFSQFSTTSRIAGSNSSNEPFATSTNYSDGTFAQNLLGGVYFPLGSGKVLLDLGVRHTWNGREVRYLTEGDIVDNPDGPPTITPRRSRADILTVSVGVAIRF